MSGATAPMEEMLRRYPGATDEALQESGEQMRALASQLAPKDTGALAASGVVEQTGPMTWDVVFGRGLGDARAVVQEFGSIYQPPQSFLRPARDQISVAANVAKRIRGIL